MAGRTLARRRGVASRRVGDRAGAHAHGQAARADRPEAAGEGTRSGAPGPGRGHEVAHAQEARVELLAYDGDVRGRMHSLRAHGGGTGQRWRQECGEQQARPRLPAHARGCTPPTRSQGRGRKDRGECPIAGAGAGVFPGTHALCRPCSRRRPLRRAGGVPRGDPAHPLARAADHLHCAAVGRKRCTFRTVAGASPRAVRAAVQSATCTSSARTTRPRPAPRRR